MIGRSVYRTRKKTYNEGRMKIIKIKKERFHQYKWIIKKYQPHLIFALLVNFSCVIIWFCGRFVSKETCFIKFIIAMLRWVIRFALCKHKNYYYIWVQWRNHPSQWFLGHFPPNFIGFFSNSEGKTVNLCVMESIA